MVTIASLALSMQATALWRTSHYWNEPAHLAAGLVQWRHGTSYLYRVNPPLVRTTAALPLLWRVDCRLPVGIDGNPYRYEFMAGRQLVTDRRRLFFTDLRLARLMVLPWTAMAIGLVYHWIARLWSPAAGRLGAVLLVCNPVFLGWGATVMPDVPAAAVGLLASYAFWSWLHDRSWTLALGVGVAFGLALLVKSTWIVLPVLWAIAIAAVNGWISRPMIGWGRDALHWLTLTIVGLVILDVGYNFHGCSIPIAGYATQSDALAKLQDLVVAMFPLAGQLPIGLPVDFLTGLDLQKQDFERGKTSFVAGHRMPRGVWWYYGYVWLNKMPEPLLMVWGAAASGRLIRWRRPHDLAFAVSTGVTVVGLAILLSSQTGFSQHGRYSLILLPLLLVACGGFLHRISSIAWLRWALGVTSVAIVLGATPNLTSYANWISGGGHRLHHRLLGSEVDWGQDYLQLEVWKERHLPDEKLWCLLPHVDLAAVDADRRRMFPAGGRWVDGRPRPGWYACSVACLHDFPRQSDLGRWFVTKEPVDWVGNTVCIYRVQ